MNKISGTCDYCGQPVEAKNDATIVKAKVKNHPVLILSSKPRHFLPEGNCPGSRSWAQYIAGQPRGNRGYEYDEALEPVVRAAYKKVVEENS